VYLTREVPAQNLLGMIEVVHKPGLQDFRLLEEDGSLRRQDASRHVVFELRFKTRKTYWQYLHPPGGPGGLEPGGDITDRLVTKKPMPLQRNFILVTNGVRNLPNPPNLAIRYKADPADNELKMFSEIYL
jgi:hypothetical protein